MQNSRFRNVKPKLLFFYQNYLYKIEELFKHLP